MQFVASLTHLAFPFFPAGAKALEASPLPAALPPIARPCVLFLGESCKTTPAVALQVLALLGGGLSSLRLKNTRHGGQMGTHSRDKPGAKILILHRFMPRSLKNHRCTTLLLLERCKQGIGEQEIYLPAFPSRELNVLLGQEVSLGALCSCGPSPTTRQAQLLSHWRD